MATLPADPNKIFEITITSFIKVNYDDKMKDFEEIIKNETTIYNHKKFILGDQMDKRFYKTIEEAPSNLAITTLTEEEQIVSFVKHNASSKNAVSFAVIVGAILRLLM